MLTFQLSRLTQMGNKGAYIRFEAPDMKPNIVTFSSVVSIFSPFGALTIIASVVLYCNGNRMVNNK